MELKCRRYAPLVAPPLTCTLQSASLHVCYIIQVEASDGVAHNIYKLLGVWFILEEHCIGLIINLGFHVLLFRINTSAMFIYNFSPGMYNLTDVITRCDNQGSASLVSRASI